MSTVSGIYLSCTLKSEPVDTIVADELMREAYSVLISKTLIDLYASVHQIVQMVFIARLIYVLKVIQYAKNNRDVFKDFGGLYPYLTYMQANDKLASVLVFKELLKYEYCNSKSLRDYTGYLIMQIGDLLKDNRYYFGLKETKETQAFIIAIDEANSFVSSSYSILSKLLNPSGNQRSLMSILAQEATLINNLTCYSTKKELHKGNNILYHLHLKMDPAQ